MKFPDISVHTYSDDQLFLQKSMKSGADVEDIVPPPPPPPPPIAPPPPEFYIENGDTIWIQVDNMPEFAGGDKARDGTVAHARTVKSLDPEIDAEAVIVVNSLPAFEKPGIKNGKPVAVCYMLPITFELK